MKYRAIAFSTNGEHIKDGYFMTKEEAWDYVNNWGSRWIFFPITGIITESDYIVDMCDIVEKKRGKIKGISEFIKNREEAFIALLN